MAVSGLGFLWLILTDALWSAMAALGFAVLFNVPVRTLWGCAMCGATGHAVRTLLMEAGLGIELATLAGATVVGFLGGVFARQWRTPTTTFTVSGAIPMVPGVFAYETMIGLLTIADTSQPVNYDLVAEVIVSAVKTALILGAIAFGIAAPGLLFRRRRAEG